MSAPTTTMPSKPPHPKPVLTLIVASTRTHGIGRAGTLPWPQLKGEMGYFARVTKRPPAHDPAATALPRNAVIMGRKTWDSIPPRFRPLKNRLNCVVTRSVPTTTTTASASATTTTAMGETTTASGKDEDEVLFVGSIEEAVRVLGGGQHAGGHEEQSKQSASGRDIGHVFVIGGASIYAAALQMAHTRRVLLTRIREPDFECDTFVPLDMEGEAARQAGWNKAGLDRLQEVTGEVFGEAGPLRSDGDVEYEFCLYER